MTDWQWLTSLQNESVCSRGSATSQVLKSCFFTTGTGKRSLTCIWEMLRFKWHRFSLDRDYFKTPTPERNWDEARFKLISLQIRLPAASTTSASRICRLAEMKIFQSWRMTAYRWEHGRGWRRPAPTQRPLLCTSCWRQQTNTQCGPILFGPSEQEEECFSGGLRAIRICTFIRRWGRFQWRQILWINSTSSHSASLSFCSFYTENHHLHFLIT